MVEHAAVNRGVAGSSPARGAEENGFRFLCQQRRSAGIRLRGQEVKTSPFHGGNTGSIPVGVTGLEEIISSDLSGSLAQLVRATGS